MKGMFLKSILVALLIFTFVVPSSFALREIQRTTPDLVRSSSDIVVAKCISSETVKDEKYNFVFTYITFEIEDSVKELIGSDELVLRMPGGEYDGILVDIPGMPNFQTDREYVIYLGKKNADGFHTIQSPNHGVFHVITDDSTGSRIVLGTPRDMTVYENSTSRIISDQSVTVENFIYSLKKIK